MIKELNLKNWKSFEDATLYVDPLTILIGTNASGKSNLLDAFLFLNRVSSGVGIFQAINGDVNLPQLRGGLEWVCRRPENRFSLEILVDGLKDSQEYRYDLTIQINGVKAEVFKEELVMLTYGKRKGHPTEKTLFVTKQEESTSPAIPTYFYTGTQGRGKLRELSRAHTVLSQTESMDLRKEIQKGARQVLSQLKSIFVFDPIPSHMRDYSPFSETLQADGSNIAGVLAGIEEDSRGQLEDTLTRYLKQLPERDIEMLQELGQERSIDVIVTTHNPALLDAAGSGMVPFIAVAHRENHTGISLLTQLEDIQQLPKLMAGGSLGRMATQGRIEDALKTSGSDA